MKNHRAWLYAGMLLMFLVFLTGFFILRNAGGGLRVETGAKPTAAQTEPAATETEPDFPIDLNTADRAQLEALPGIGPVLAERILDYRVEHGSFSAVEELLQVEGIGEKRLEELLDYITVEEQE